VRKISRFGWKPDLPDHRDHVLSLFRSSTLPSFVDLRYLCPPVYDQGELGSCTANAIGAVLEIQQVKQGAAPFPPSRLFIYYNERVMEGTVGFDAGAEIRDGMKSVATLGACIEEAWPYDIGKFAQRPPDYCYYDGLQRQAIEYLRVEQTGDAILKCLADGYPIAFGFTVYASFESNEVASRGVIGMPKRYEQPVGGHAVVLVGYDRSERMFLVRNSWGATWGQAGYFWMPFDYVLNQDLADDFWTIRKTE
jgi:C1A family cysteine protease